MAARLFRFATAIGLCCAMGQGTRAKAACTVDSVDSRVRSRSGQRTDRVRIFVESGTPDCTWIRLSHPGGGVVESASARVLRGDTRNARMGPNHLVWSADGSDLVADFAVPGLRTGDIVVLDVERRVGQDHRWDPAAWGTAGWAALQVRGKVKPSAANVPTDRKGWYVERAEVEAAGGNLAVQFGTPPLPTTPVSHGGTAELHIELRPEASPPPGEPPLGQTRVQWHLPIGSSGGHAVAWPTDATETSCRVEGAPAALVLPNDHGCRVLEAAPDSTLVAAWTLPRLQLAGEVGPARRTDSIAGTGPATHGPLPPIGVQEAVGPLHLTVTGPGVSLRGQVRQSDHVSPVSGEGSLRLQLPGTSQTDPLGLPPHAGWWVTAIHGQPLLANREALVGAVARSALAASVPEPGLPARLRGRSADASSIPEVQALVRSQVRVGQTPGQRSLQPRKLLKARKSTYGTEWELALITARYLRQLRLDAVPIPVRLPHVGETDPGMPAGFDHAVVRVLLDSDTGRTEQWLDVACPVCAPGELRPSLWGADALSAAAQTLPPAPDSRSVERIVVQPDGSEQVTVELVGAAALALRLELLQLPKERRIEAIERRYAGTLDQHQGLADKGAPIHLTLHRSGVLDPPPPTARLQVPVGAHVRVPWQGDRVREYSLPPGVPEVVLAPASTVQVHGEGLSFTRTLGVETDGTRVSHEVLSIRRPILARAAMQALHERLSEAPAVRLAVPGDTPDQGSENPPNNEAGPPHSP